MYFRLARLGIDRRSPVAERRGPSDAELAHLYRNVELPKRDKPGDYVEGELGGQHIPTPF